MRMVLLVAGGVGSLSCGKPPVTPAPAPVCRPAPDASGGRRWADVFVDGKPVARGVIVRLEQASPETYGFEGEEPVGLRAVPTDRIDLIQFLRGPEAESSYGICSGYVAVLVTTKP